MFAVGYSTARVEILGIRLSILDIQHREFSLMHHRGLFQVLHDSTSKILSFREPESSNCHFSGEYDSVVSMNYISSQPVPTFNHSQSKT
jgi:hypothetical protein